MAELTTVARPYAKAAFLYAQDQGRLAQWSNMLGLAAQVASDADFARYLSRPILTSAEQAAALITACGDSLDAEARNFLTDLVTHKRLKALPAVSALFDELKANAERAVDVDVASAFALSEAQQVELARVLSGKLGRQVSVTAQVDPALIGGVVIRSGDLVIDASIRGKLGKLSAALNS